jgi:hypothetical protein
MKEAATPISPQDLFAIEVRDRVPVPHVLHGLAQGLELEYDTLPALVGAADVMVREYLQTQPEAEAAVIGLFRAAQAREFADRDHLCQRVERARKSGLEFHADVLTVRIDA